jgi:hypothetical protein
VIDGLPRRELVVGKKAPGAAAAHHVEDGVEDLAQGMEPGTAGSLWDRQMGIEHLPLFVGEVALVCSSHSARYPTEPPH